MTKTSENTSFVGETLTAGKTDLNYNTKSDTETGNIKTVIPDISDTYFEKLEVIIGEGAFRDLDGLRTIIIPGTVKEILMLY